MAEDDGGDTYGANQQPGLQTAFTQPAAQGGLAFQGNPGTGGTAFATPQPAAAQPYAGAPATTTVPPPTTAAAAPNPGAPATITANPNGTGFENVGPLTGPTGAPIVRNQAGGYVLGQYL